MTDGELVARVRAGQTGAYEQLVRRWSGRVLAVCHARVRCRHAAEDLAQETLLRGLRDIGTLREPDKFGPWLRGIAHRTCLDWLKAKQTAQVPFAALAGSQPPDDLLMGDAEPPDGRIDRADETRRLMAEVESLPDDCREVIMLYYYNDVTYRDLSELLGVSTATINARLTRGRALLRERLQCSRRTS